MSKSPRWAMWIPRHPSAAADRRLDGGHSLARQTDPSPLQGAYRCLSTTLTPPYLRCGQNASVRLLVLQPGVAGCRWRAVTAGDGAGERGARPVGGGSAQPYRAGRRLGRRCGERRGALSRRSARAGSAPGAASGGPPFRHPRQWSLPAHILLDSAPPRGRLFGRTVGSEPLWCRERWGKVMGRYPSLGTRPTAARAGRA